MKIIHFSIIASLFSLISLFSMSSTIQILPYQIDNRGESVSYRYLATFNNTTHDTLVIKPITSNCSSEILLAGAPSLVIAPHSHLEGRITWIALTSSDSKNYQNAAFSINKYLHRDRNYFMFFEYNKNNFAQQKFTINDKTQDYVKYTLKIDAQSTAIRFTIKLNELDAISKFQ